MFPFGRLLRSSGFWTRTCGYFYAFTDQAQYITKGNDIPFLLENFLQHTTLLSADFEIDLVSFQFYDRITLLHYITLLDRKSTRLNSSHQIISYPVFSLKKKTP